jgi:hypothetical protein
MRKIILLICCFFMTGCGASPANPVNPDSTVISEPGPGTTPQGTSMPDNYAPQAGDKKLSRADIYLDSTQINTMESYPLQFSLRIVGSLPNPCHQLRVNILPPDTQNRIQIEVYAVVDPGVMCTEVLQAFDVTIPLGSFPTGHYSIFVNGTLVGEIIA